MAITLTPTAAEKVKDLMAQPEQSGAKGLRVQVVGGGCSGLSYKIALEREAGENDTVFESEGVTVYIDPKSALFIDGMQVDYHESLMGSGFAFSNPNATGTCGCGTSFTA
jgi:iron-sulfur cluster assembly protein